MDTINVIYTCDDRFLDYLAVSIDSLIEAMDQAERGRLAIYVVQINFSADQKNWLAKVVAQRSAEVKLHFYDYILANRFGKCAYKPIEIVTLVYYLPLFFPTLERAIFIDADTLLVEDIGELWRIDLDGHWIATTPCVFDQESLHIYNKSTQGHFWSVEQTLNAGIMVLDFQQMRNLGVTKILDEWTERHQESISLPEQEAIAFNFPTRKIIDHKWNWRGALSCSEPYWASRSASTWDAYARIAPAMIHFQAPFRPTATLVNSKYFDLWKRRHHSLGLVADGAKKMRFLEFVLLMQGDKWRILGPVKSGLARPSSVIAIVSNNFRHLLTCLIAYPKYCRDPLGFKFPTFEPMN